MLAEIQQRDAALQGANDQLKSRTLELEEEISERLRAQEELKTLNITLEQRVAERSAAAEQRAEEVARSKEAMHKQTRILQSILDSMSDGVIVADEAGAVILFNPAAEEILRLDAADVRTGEWAERYGFYLPDMVTPYPNDQFPLTRAIQGEAVEAAEVFVVDEMRTPGGLWLSIDATPLTDEDGVLHNGVAIVHNITSHKRAEEALLKAKDAAEAANRSKSQFLANMSHELRTPLNAVIGYSEMLQEQAEDAAQHDSIPDLQKIHAAGKHLQSLIDGILDLSKIEAGKMELFLETFDVSPLVDDIVATVKPLLDKKGNALEVRCAEELAYIRADMTKVRQVLFNLLSNAGKFTDHGAITLEVSRRSLEGRDWMRFRVTDTGIGMSREQIDRLFQDFTQVDASTTRKYGGTGLGLAISRRFSEMMGGHISVQSALGKGSSFTFELPAKVESGAETERMTALEKGTAASHVCGIASPNTVLVIDDDPIVRDLMARLLEKEGFDVVLATCGQEGLDLARTLRPSVITLDVMMPGLDGWAVLTSLKSNPDVADIPVVMVTMTDDRHRGYTLGASGYLTKPIDPARLAAILRKHTHIGRTAPVLVVDDDPAARDMTRRLLKREGWDVVEAENGRVALQRVAERTPSLIVLDLMMPEMDGFDLITTLRNTRTWQAIPIVVVTAKDLTEAESQRLNGSVERILRKAAHGRDELLRAVREQVRVLVQIETIAT